MVAVESELVEGWIVMEVDSGVVERASVDVEDVDSETGSVEVVDELSVMGTDSD